MSHNDALDNSEQISNSRALYYDQHYTRPVRYPLTSTTTKFELGIRVREDLLHIIIVLGQT
jgi:hypothetical protein